MAERSDSERSGGGRAALVALAPLVDALASASAGSPEEVARRLTEALPRLLGWHADVHATDASAPPAPREGFVLGEGVATVPMGPGWELRIAAADPADAASLHSVAALAAQALWLARSGLGELAEANRRLREAAHRKDALVWAGSAELRAAAAALEAPAPAAPEQRADEARRLRHIADELERSARPGTEPRAAEVRVRHAGGGQPRVLVVDDEPDAREALEMLLSPEYEVLAAEDGEAGVELARTERPDVVLMDLFMPRLDGFQALERLRADPVTADIPVIFVSGRGDDAVKVRSLDLGAVDFLQKPFSERELRARVERTLRLVRSQSQLRELAQTDALTGLANLRAFRSRIEDEVKRARRYRTPLACVMADMDNLKPINDQLGHAAGDRAIAAIAAVIREELRETDFGARYGGDEFVVLLPHTTAEEGRVFAERVCARIRERVVDVAGHCFPLSASFGVSPLPEDGESGADALVRAADAALYAAKRAGRGRVELAAADRGAATAS
ncbi:MAG TPA: diguanylate cyclase [Anaeromyxobacteraceae bacterium]|nr:diguanylate cyclase [Anaeromyxobacteraceae bacterium]